MVKPDPNPNHDRDSDHDDNANDNGKGAVAPAPASGALASLAALKTALNSVDTRSALGRSGLPMLQFKREGDGTWRYGQKSIVVEAGSRWAVNPMSFKWGYICFNDNNKPVGEYLVPVSEPMPDVTKLPDKGFPWTEQWAVNMKCLDGADTGVEVVYKPTTKGGIPAVAGLINETRDRLNDGHHDIAAILLLEKDSYQHSQFGRVWTPVLTNAGWMPLEGPAPAPKPTSPPPTEQPRRRRVA